MARIRSIKPEFWTSEQVLECSPIARLMFVGMWNFADDMGRMPCSPKSIKAQVFPSDDISLDSVRGMLNELSSNGLILIYSVEDKDYLQITGWAHQRIDKPQPAKYPAPFFDDSKNAPRTIPPDRKGEDRKGKEDAAGAAPAKFTVVPDLPPRTEAELEKLYFDRGKEVLGTGSGGLLAKLLSSKKKSVALARAAIEMASTKSNPREYIGAIIRGKSVADEPQWLDGIPGVI